MRFPFAMLGVFIWASALAAEEAAPTPPAQPAGAPIGATFAPANTEDTGLVIAPKTDAPAPANQPAQGQSGAQVGAQPGAWGSGPQAAPPADRKPGEPIISGEGQLIIGPKITAAAAQGDGAKPVVLPAAPQKNTPPANATQPQPAPQTTGGSRQMPVLRLPIMFPSTSISSAGGPNMNFQVTGDAQLETREIVAPLPLGAYGPYLTPYSLPYAYGSARPAAPDKAQTPAKK
ncbi:MAG: hypothetical protein HY291_06145 [Planctomycetes bacterium]|nr:hypothetical protein [Planctomycetota bacterium]